MSLLAIPIAQITLPQHRTGADRQREHMERKRNGEPRRPTRVKSGTAKTPAQRAREYRARKNA